MRSLHDKSKVYRFIFIALLVFALVWGHGFCFEVQACNYEELSVSQTFTVKAKSGLSVPQASFTYTLKAKDGLAPLPEGSKDGVYRFTLTGKASQQICIDFPKKGKYEYILSLESYAYNAGDSLEYVYDQRTYEITVLAWEYQGKVIGKTRQIKGDDGYKYDSVAYNHTYNGPPPAYFRIWVGCCMPCDKSNPSPPPAKPLGRVLKFLETGFAKTGEILTSSWIIWLIGLLAVLLVLLLIYKWWREHKDRRAAAESSSSAAETPPTDAETPPTDAETPSAAESSSSAAETPPTDAEMPTAAAEPTSVTAETPLTDEAEKVPSEDD